MLTGIGTVLADDPSLNVRPEGLTPRSRALLKLQSISGMGNSSAPGASRVRQPLRVIADSQLRTPATAKTLRLDGQILIAGIREAGEEHSDLQTRAEVLTLRADAGKLDLQDLLTTLAQREINDVLVESGPQLAGALVRQGLADELLIYTAPTLLGSQARGLMHLPGMTSMSQQLRLEFVDQHPIGNDIRIRARFVPS